MKIILFIWEILQNIIGLILTLFYKTTEEIEYKDRIIRYCKGFPGGISLGSYIFVGTKNTKTIAHEYGHSIQSKWLGPLYLFIVGIPSIVWAGLYGSVIKPTTNGYYKFYTEKWADKIGKVKRKYE
jgi:hypothetical protein